MTYSFVPFVPFCGSFWLDADDEVADSYLMIWGNFRRLFSRDLFPIHECWVATFRDEPVATFVIARQHRVNSAHFRIALDREIDRDTSRPATDCDLTLGDRNDSFPHPAAPDLHRVKRRRSGPDHRLFAFTGFRRVLYNCVIGTECGTERRCRMRLVNPRGHHRVTTLTLVPHWLDAKLAFVQRAIHTQFHRKRFDCELRGPTQFTRAF